MRHEFRCRRLKTHLEVSGGCRSLGATSDNRRLVPSALELQRLTLIGRNGLLRRVRGGGGVLEAVFDVLHALLGLLLQVRGLGGALTGRVGRSADATRDGTAGQGMHERRRGLVSGRAGRRSSWSRSNRRSSWSGLEGSVGVGVVLRSALALDHSVCVDMRT